jgi:hypothetical protein
MEELHDFYCSPSKSRMIRSRRMILGRACNMDGAREEFK